MNYETYLYRLYDDASELLYIGITRDLETRFGTHSRRRWWADVGSVRVATFPTRSEALAAEKAAIKTELPKYNVAHVELTMDQPLGDALASITEADQKRRRQRIARYALYPEHHIHDLLATAGVRRKRWDVPQSYHSDAEWLATLEDHQRRRVEWLSSISPQHVFGGPLP